MSKHFPKLKCDAASTRNVCFWSTYDLQYSKCKQAFLAVQPFSGASTKAHTIIIILQDNCHVSFIEYLNNMLNAYIGPKFQPLFQSETDVDFRTK